MGLLSFQLTYDSILDEYQVSTYSTPFFGTFKLNLHTPEEVKQAFKLSDEKMRLLSQGRTVVFSKDGNEITKFIQRAR